MHGDDDDDGASAFCFLLQYFQPVSSSFAWWHPPALLIVSNLQWWVPICKAIANWQTEKNSIIALSCLPHYQSFPGNKFQTLWQRKKTNCILLTNLLHKTLAKQTIEQVCWKKRQKEKARARERVERVRAERNRPVKNPVKLMPLWVTAVIAKSNDFSSKDLQLIPATTTRHKFLPWPLPLQQILTHNVELLVFLQISASAVDFATRL
jgi:hypothetical protein